MKRFRMDVFPAARILSAEGSVLGKPNVQPPTVDSMVEAIAGFTVLEERFQRQLAAADMTKPKTRADFVKRHLVRGDDARAVELYRGFPGDASDERFLALAALASHMTEAGKLEETQALLQGAEATFTKTEQRSRLEKLRCDALWGRVKQAAVEKDRELCHDLLSEITARFPESEIAAKEKELSEWIDAHVP
ncbi:hypothetical protein HY251_02230 [bacterium]|nr:hypothetical protein [bacterium]